MEFLKIIYESIIMIISFDRELYEIILLSLKTSGLATFLASIIGIFTGYLLAIYNFRFKKFIVIFIAALMGIPPVVAGLLVYFLFSNSGPFGVLSLIFTPSIMVIAQIIIVYPIIATLIRQLFLEYWKSYKDTLRANNMPTLSIIYIFIRSKYPLIITILLSGFSRAISEVGSVMIVGGNIEHYTRVMTTAISLETSIGNLEKAMSLGFVLLIITMLINYFVFTLNKNEY